MAGNFVLTKDNVLMSTKVEHSPVEPPSDGYAEGLFQLMEDLTKKAGDTVWLMDHETVFERCWFIIEQQEGRARLEDRFPDYA